MLRSRRASGSRTDPTGASGVQIDPKTMKAKDLDNLDALVPAYEPTILNRVWSKWP